MWHAFGEEPTDGEGGTLMRNRLAAGAFGLAGIFVIALLSSAQTSTSSQPPKTNAGQPAAGAGARDFSGVWDPAPYMKPAGEVDPWDLRPNPRVLPPFNDWGKAKYEANAKFIAAGAVLDCDPFGTARNFFTPRPFEVIQARDRLVQHWEYYDNWREIWTDGRKIPDDVEPDYMGYSVGKWDGDAFIVESAAYNGKQFLSW